MGMARMTDIDELLEKVAKIQASGGSQEKRVGEIILAITNAPTVEVVRCKECKHRYFNEYIGEYCCEQWADGFDTVCDFEEFCSRGERNDND